MSEHTNQTTDLSSLKNQPGDAPLPIVAPSTSHDPKRPPLATNLFEGGTPVNDWVYDLPIEDYHRDRTRISSSTLKLIRRSPRAFLSKFTEEFPDKDTDARRVGRAMHCLLWEPDKLKDRYRVAPKFVGKTLDGKESSQSKEAKEKKAAWLAELPLGCEVLSQEEYDKLGWMLDSIAEHPDALNLIKNGAREVSGFYVDPLTNLRCRIRPDFLGNDLGVLADLKTTSSLELEPFQKQIVKLGYDFSLAMYCEGISIISGKAPEYAALISVETAPPFECAVWIADATILERGQYQYRKALIKLSECVSSGTWPRYQERMEGISLPEWLLKNPDWE